MTEQRDFPVISHNVDKSRLLSERRIDPISPELLINKKIQPLDIRYD